MVVQKLQFDTGARLALHDLIRRHIRTGNTSRVVAYFCVLKLIAKKSIREIVSHKMADEMIAYFRSQNMGFGKHNGESIVRYPDGSSMRVAEYQEHADCLLTNCR